MRKKIELEYIFSSSVKVLFSRLSTPAGLSEWFADDVFQKENHFVFVWNATEHTAILKDSKSNSFVRFQWEDRLHEDEYFEFNIRVEPLTQDVALIITDFTDEEDEEDSVELWNKQMDMLHRTLGA
ncbi:MAG: START-like domain-containing protein [Odoribacter sp.]|nr:START-like domain-containing protein [Odoribacter sp.]